MKQKDYEYISDHLSKIKGILLNISLSNDVKVKEDKYCELNELIKDVRFQIIVAHKVALLDDLYKELVDITYSICLIKENRGLIYRASGLLKILIDEQIKKRKIAFQK